MQRADAQMSALAQGARSWTVSCRGRSIIKHRAYVLRPNLVRSVSFAAAATHRPGEGGTAHRIEGVGDDAEGVGGVGQVVREGRVAQLVSRRQDRGAGKVAHVCGGNKSTRRSATGTNTPCSSSAAGCVYRTHRLK